MLAYQIRFSYDQFCGVFFFSAKYSLFIMCCTGTWLGYVRLRITLLCSCKNVCGRCKASDVQVKGDKGKIFTKCLESRVMSDETGRNVSRAGTHQRGAPPGREIR